MPVEKPDPDEPPPKYPYKSVEEALDDIQQKINKLVAERERLKGQGKL